MNLSIINTELAEKEGEIQVAYDPTDPSYVAPLGETTVFRPDETKGLIILVAIEGFAVILFTIMFTCVVSRYWRRAHSREE